MTSVKASNGQDTSPDSSLNYQYDGPSTLAVKHTQFHADNFINDPGFRWSLHSMPPEKRKTFWPAYVKAMLKAASLNSAIVDQVILADGTVVCGATWLPPGKKIDNPATLIPSGLPRMVLNMGVRGLKRILVEWPEQVDDAKKEFIRDEKGKRIRKYYYLWMISTDEKYRGQGIARKVIEHFQERATREGFPIWLESSTEGSRRLYERCGFKCVKVMVLGKGETDADGNTCKGGEGIKLFAMLWKPEWKKSQLAQNGDGTAAK